MGRNDTRQGYVGKTFVLFEHNINDSTYIYDEYVTDTQYT